MSPAERTRSQIGKANRNKGAVYERAIANAIKPWFPTAKRSRDNGSANTADTGDIAGTPGVFWSCKDDKSGDSFAPGVIGGWMNEGVAKCDGAIVLLVQKRRGHAEPLHSWCSMWFDDFVLLAGGPPFPRDLGYVRMELWQALNLLSRGGYACPPPLEDIA